VSKRTKFQRLFQRERGVVAAAPSFSPLFSRFVWGSERRPLAPCLAVVGPRAKILRELNKLKIHARAIRRQTPLWQGEEAEARSCLAVWLTGSCLCNPIADTYKLTSGELVVRRQKMKRCGPFFCPCLGQESSRNSMDLSLVKDVDSTSQSKGCCCCKTGYDAVIVQAKAEGEVETEDGVGMKAPGHGNKMQSVVLPKAGDPFGGLEDEERLILEIGDGEKIRDVIRNAVEEATLNRE
jgi:hypothetical protein